MCNPYTPPHHRGRRVCMCVCERALPTAKCRPEASGHVSRVLCLCCCQPAWWMKRSVRACMCVFVCLCERYCALARVYVRVWMFLNARRCIRVLAYVWVWTHVKVLYVCCPQMTVSLILRPPVKHWGRMKDKENKELLVVRLEIYWFPQTTICYKTDPLLEDWGSLCPGIYWRNH